MTTRCTELIREGDFVLEAEVDKRFGELDDPWAPSYPLESAQRLYEAGQAMKGSRLASGPALRKPVQAGARGARVVERRPPTPPHPASMGYD